MKSSITGPVPYNPLRPRNGNFQRTIQPVLPDHKRKWHHIDLPTTTNLESSRHYLDIVAAQKRDCSTSPANFTPLDTYPAAAPES